MAHKNHLIYRYPYLALLIGWISTGVWAQTEPVSEIHISEADLENYRNNPDFDYVSTEGVSWFFLFWEWLKRMLQNILEAIFGNMLSESAILFILQVLPYFAIAVLAFIFYKLILKGLLKTYATKQPERGLVALTDDEKLILEADLSALQKEALEQQNYRSALRYGYLKTIKHLSEKGHIKRAPEKTNTDYLAELSQTEYETPFSKLTHWYDFVWYGNMPLDAARYAVLEDLIHRITQPIATV